MGKSLKLYAEFAKSDVVICSSFGLYKILQKKSPDFLSSIEVVIVDQVDYLQMQNIEHLTFILDNLNLKPKEFGKDTDINRLRTYFLENQQKSYRNLVFFSPVQTSMMNSIFQKYKTSNQGQAILSPLSKPAVVKNKDLSHILFMFKRLTNKTASISDEKIKYLSSNILKQMKHLNTTGTLIYIPDYFDFVRVKTMLKKRFQFDPSDSFAELTEYDSLTKQKTNRKLFSQGEAKILVMTERYYFFNRKLPPKDKVNSVIFYGLPTYDEFFHDIAATVTKGDSSFCHVMFGKEDFSQLKRVVGKSTAAKMVKGKEGKETWFFENGISK